MKQLLKHRGCLIFVERVKSCNNDPRRGSIKSGSFKDAIILSTKSGCIYPNKEDGVVTVKK